jgi:hypothetical protein
MEMNMNEQNGVNTMMALEEIKTGLDQIRGATSLRQRLVASIAALSPEQVFDLVIGGGLAGTSIAMPSAIAPVAAAPAVSNVIRSASGRRAFQLVNGNPSLPWAVRIILKEAGQPIHADDIFNALVAYKWISKNMKDPRARLSNVLSSQSHLFLRAKDVGRGFYTLSPTADFQPLPASVKRAKAAPAITRLASGSVAAAPAKAAAPATVKAKAKAAPEKKPTHKPLSDRKETMGPALKYLLAHKGSKLIAATDVATSIKAEPNEMQGPLIAMLRSGAWKATSQTNEEGKTLYKINPAKLAAHVERFEEKTGKKLLSKPVAKKPAKKAKKPVAKAAPKKAAKKPGIKKAAPKPAAKAEAPVAAAAPAAAG